MLDFNKIQQIVESVKTNIRGINFNESFESSERIVNTGLMHITTGNGLVAKIKTLTSIENNNLTNTFDSNSGFLRPLRRFTIPMNRLRTVIISFLSNQSIVMELLANGAVIKSFTLTKKAKYFLIHSYTDDKLVIGYPDEHGFNLVLFDNDLKVKIKNIHRDYVGEIFMNNENIIITSCRSAEFYMVLNLNLDIITSFGQNETRNEPYFAEKAINEDCIGAKFCIFSPLFYIFFFI